METKPSYPFESPYRLGADHGLWMGLWLSMLFFASVFTTMSQIAGIVSIILMAAVPVTLYRGLRSTYVRQHGMSPFSSLWMQGIVTMGCGALIASAVAAIYLKWIDPAWTSRQIDAMIKIYSSVEGGEWIVDTLNEMVRQHLLPSTGQMVAQMLWLMLFSGSLLSLIVAALARVKRVDDRKSPNHPQ